MFPAFIAIAIVLCACNEQVCDTSEVSGGSAAEAPAANGEAEYSWDGPTPAQATIVYIGNFRGFLKPCGCAVQQSGGLLRMGTVMEELNSQLVRGQPPTERSAPGPMGADGELTSGLMLKGLPSGGEAPEAVIWPELPSPQPIWLIECGNFAAPQNHYPAERVKTHLNSLSKLKSRGFIAAVLGSTELQLDAGLAVESFADCPVRLTSCNLQSKLPEVVIEPYVEITPGWYLIGVSTWAPMPADPPVDTWWALTEPVAAVQAVLTELPADAQVILVATHQTGEIVRRLAALPITLLIGHGSANDRQWTTEFAPGYPAPPSKAIRLKLLSVDTEPADPTARILPWEFPLTEEWADDVEIAAVVESEKLAVREKLLAAIGQRDNEGWRDVDWGSSSKYLPDREATLEVYLNSEPIYVGSRECRKCHPDSYQVWKGTAHSHALLTLIQKDENETLDCLQCHVAGLLEPSGYDPFSSRDEVSAVTCEACHGPGSKHLALMNLPDQPEKLGITPGDLAGCTICHDQYNSPAFETRVYWERIGHEDEWQDNVQRIRSGSSE